MTADLHTLPTRTTPGIKTRRALHSARGHNSTEIATSGPRDSSMSGGVESRHAANSDSTRGSDASHKAVTYGTVASGDNAYQAPLAGVATGPLTSADGDSDALAPSRGILLAAVIGAILYAVIWMLWPAR